MRILERVHAFLPLLSIEIFLIFPPQNSNEVKNGCTNSRVRIGLFGTYLAEYFDLQKMPLNKVSILNRR